MTDTEDLRRMLDPIRPYVLLAGILFFPIHDRIDDMIDGKTEILRGTFAIAMTWIAVLYALFRRSPLQGTPPTVEPFRTLPPLPPVNRLPPADETPTTDLREDG